MSEHELYDEVVSSRFFWSKGWNSPWWKPLITVGIRGGDENCNRTLGLRLPGGALFACLNVPLRQEPCVECQLLQVWADPKSGKQIDTQSNHHEEE